jgi:hypothetical protein
MTPFAPEGFRQWATGTCPHLQPAGSQIAVHGAVVAAAGFEDRTLALVNRLRPGPHGHLALLVYKDWQDDNRVEEVAAAYGARGLQADESSRLAYDRFAPDDFGDTLHDWLLDRAIDQVLVDVSSMSRMAILIVLDVCRELNLDTTVFYAEAGEYGPTKDEYEKGKLEGLSRPSVQVYSGISGVLRARRLSSVALQGEPSALIAFMSMNELLTQAIINSLYPSRLFLINGRPPKHQWREEATAWIHDQLRREWREKDNRLDPQNQNLPGRVTSTLWYDETVGELLHLYWALARDYRVILAPTGSKMQTVACYIVKGMHPDIHVEYPTPKGFLHEYSNKVGDCWTVSLGRFGDFISECQRVDFRKHLAVRADV